jgi:predicted transcriptional regulator
MFVWNCLENGRSFKEMVEELRRVYDVTDEQASASVNKILSDMRSR